MERQIQFIRERISDLRCQKQVSERKMSLDLGHSTSYIRSITSLAQSESEPSVKRPESVSSLPLYQFF